MLATAAEQHGHGGGHGKSESALRSLDQSESVRASPDPGWEWAGTFDSSTPAPDKQLRVAGSGLEVVKIICCVRIDRNLRPNPNERALKLLHRDVGGVYVIHNPFPIREGRGEAVCALLAVSPRDLWWCV